MDSSIKRKADLLRNVSRSNTPHSQYTRVCVVCEKKEYPNATIAKLGEFWLCESCLNVLKNLINSNK